MVAAANLVACDQVSVEVVQLAITLLHSRPEQNGAYVQYICIGYNGMGSLTQRQLACGSADCVQQ